MAFNTSNGLGGLQWCMVDLTSLCTHVLCKYASIMYATVTLHGTGIPSPGDPSFLDGLKTPGRCGLSRSSSYNLSKLETCP